MAAIARKEAADRKARAATVRKAALVTAARPAVVRRGAAAIARAIVEPGLTMMEGD